MPTDATNAKVEAEVAAEAAERRAVEAKAERTHSLNDQAAQTTAETKSKIDKLAATKTADPGDKSPR